jgi:hypothetical protein
MAELLKSRFEPVISSLGRDLYTDHAHKGYLVKWQLIAPLCKKWSGNRDTDKSRVKEMIQYVASGGYVPKFIHVAELQDEGLVCYDGNHRREVFNSLEDPNLQCVVDVLFCASQSDVLEAFNNINKSVQLPAIYLEDSKVKDKLLALVRQYEQRYKPFLSASPRCHVPHFNRDMFTENLDQIYKSFQGLVTIDEISILLSQLNGEYSQERLCRPHNTYKSNVVDKCRQYNFWLFLDRNICIEHVKNLYDRQHPA